MTLQNVVVCAGRPLAVILLAGAVSLAAAAAQAQSGCAADFTYLSSQVKTQSLQSRLSTTPAQLISQAGSVGAAISQAQQELANLQSLQASLPSNIDPSTVQLINDGILIETNVIQVLQCVQAQQ